MLTKQLVTLTMFIAKQQQIVSLQISTTLQYLTVFLFADSVAELVEFNTNKLFIQDMKNGGTPLHWASSREVLQELVGRGCDINAVNFEEKTALHVMVERNRLECVVALLSHEAEIDLRDKDGNTALHLAIQKKLVPIVQCLVVFGCDFNIQNRLGQTPRHMVGKDACGSNEDMILYILHSVGGMFYRRSSLSGVMFLILLLHFSETLSRK